ncbi:MAG: hypothetical protein GX567_08150 [Clostridia bacterium]|nr:hypothetical protein [Clostridia bacterium]
MLTRKLIRMEVFEEHGRQIQKLENANYTRESLQIYNTELHKSFEYMFNFLVNLFGMILYDRNESIRAKIVRVLLFQKERFLEVFLNDVASSMGIDNIKQSSLEKIAKISNIFRQIRNSLAHTNQVIEDLTIVLKTIPSLSFDISSLSIDSSGKIWEVSSKLFETIQNELVKLFYDDSVFVREGDETFLITNKDRFKVSPLIFLKDNKIYSMYSSIKSGRTIEGIYNSLDLTVHIKDDEINEFAQPAKFGTEVVHNNFIYYDEKICIKVKLFRYDYSDRRKIEAKINIRFESKSILESSLELPEDLDFVISDPLYFSISQESRMNDNMKIYIEISAANKVIDRIKHNIPILCLREGTVEFRILLPQEIRIMDMCRSEALIFIENTGNLHKSIELIVSSCPEVALEFSNAQEKKGCLFMEIDLEPEEVRIEKLSFTPLIFGRINNAISVKLKDPNGILNSDSVNLVVNKRFEPTKMIDRKELLAEIREELAHGIHTVRPGLKVWHIFGNGGVGKTRFRREIVQLAAEFNFEVLELPITHYNSPSFSESKNNPLVHSFLKLDCNSKAFYKMSDEINSIIETNQNVYDSLTENLIEDFIIEHIRDTRSRKLLMIMDDAHSLSETGIKTLKKILGNLSKRLVDEELKLVIFSRPVEKQVELDMTIDRWIEGFDKEDFVYELLSDIFVPNLIPREFSERLWKKTNGFPFYIKNILMRLFEKKIIHLSNGFWILEESKIPNDNELEEYLFKSIGERGQQAQFLLNLIAALPNLKEDQIREIFLNCGFESNEFRQISNELERIDVLKRTKEDSIIVNHDIHKESWIKERNLELLEKQIFILWEKWGLENFTNEVVSKSGLFYDSECQQYMRNKLHQLQVIARILISYNGKNLGLFLDKLAETEGVLFAWDITATTEWAITGFEFLKSMNHLAKKVLEHEREDSLKMKMNIVIAETSAYLNVAGHDLHNPMVIAESLRDYYKLLEYEKNSRGDAVNLEERIRLYAALSILSVHMVLDTENENSRAFLDNSQRFFEICQADLNSMKAPSPFLIRTVEHADILLNEMKVLRDLKTMGIKELDKTLNHLDQIKLMPLNPSSRVSVLISKMILTFIGLSQSNSKLKLNPARLLRFYKLFKKTVKEIETSIENDELYSSTCAGSRIIVYLKLARALLIVYLKKKASRNRLLKSLFSRTFGDLSGKHFRFLLTQSEGILQNTKRSLKELYENNLSNLQLDWIYVLAILLRIADPEPLINFDKLASQAKSEIANLKAKDPIYWQFVAKTILNVLREKQWQAFLKNEMGIEKESYAIVAILEAISNSGN